MRQRNMCIEDWRRTVLTYDKPPYDFKSSIMLCFLAPSASASGCNDRKSNYMTTYQLQPPQAHSHAYKKDTKQANETASKRAGKDDDDTVFFQRSWALTSAPNSIKHLATSIHPWRDATWRGVRLS